MGRFATSLIAVTIVFGVVSVDVADIALAQEAGELRSTNSGEDSQAVSEGGSSSRAESSTNALPERENSKADESLTRTVSGDSPPDEKPSLVLNPSKSSVRPSFFESFLGNPMNLILLAFVGLYLFLLLAPKPGRKEAKLMKERLANLKKNDRVVLTSGIHAIVATINSDSGTVVVKVDESNSVKLTVDRASIRSVEA